MSTLPQCSPDGAHRHARANVDRPREYWDYETVPYVGGQVNSFSSGRHLGGLSNQIENSFSHTVTGDRHTSLMPRDAWRSKDRRGSYSSSGTLPTMSTCGGLTRSSTLPTVNIEDGAVRASGDNVIMQGLETCVGDFPLALSGDRECSLELNDVPPVECPSVIVVDDSDPIWHYVLFSRSLSSGCDSRQGATAPRARPVVVPHRPAFPLVMERMG
ncbi:unnamed protein product [Trypanosoma congolense IL3000]|uniref:WGS project CAEQ00000000 data, annotated contig 1278 n=1 Tax=Trypanosoma congolense (strain IL3000) TaxID=1068625 RepID=F9W560_TRYCI|nr:unnamed protein product [Trypanosoma congolense IL3000]